MKAPNVHNAQLIAAAPDMQALLYKALPFIEDMVDDPCYKKGVVKDLERAIKHVLTQIEEVAP